MMLGRSAMAAAAAFSAFGLAVLSAEKAPDSYSVVMKELGATAASLRKNVTAKDYDGLAKDAATLQKDFEAAAKFWGDRKVDDALTLSKNGSKAAADLAAAVTAKDDAKIAAASTAVTSTCAACHMAHRIRNEDGTYEIK